MKTVVYPFVGEFSYALNWCGPILHKEFKEVKDIKKVVATLPEFSMIFRHFCDEVLELPDSITSRLKYPATIGEHTDGRDIVPDFVIDYCTDQYPGCKIKTPSQVNAKQETYDAVYEHLKPLASVEDKVKTFLDSFKKEDTVVVLPKYRSRKGNHDIQNWDAEEWRGLIYKLIENGFNVVSFYYEAKHSAGGSLHLDIEHPKFKEYKILPTSTALDEQAWILKHSLCSLYGSTGAVNVPFWIGTPTFALMQKDYGKRLFYTWQRNLTDDHRLNHIELIEDFSIVTHQSVYDIFETYLKTLR